MYIYIYITWTASSCGMTSHHARLPFLCARARRSEEWTSASERKKKVYTGTYWDANTRACEHTASSVQRQKFKVSGVWFFLRRNTEKWTPLRLKWGVITQKWSWTCGFKASKTWNGRSTTSLAAADEPAGGWRYVDFFLLTTWTTGGGGVTVMERFGGARLGEKLTRCSFCLRRVALTVTAVGASSDASRDSLESEAVISPEA